jgi:hypothetical protein
MVQIKICPKCRKEQLNYPLVNNSLDKDGKTYICLACRVKA